MPDTPSTSSVQITVDEALQLAQALGGLAAVALPGSAATVALATGAATLIRNTLLPAIKNHQPHVITIAEQAAEAAEMAAERLRVGAPPAQIN